MAARRIAGQMHGVSMEMITLPLLLYVQLSCLKSVYYVITSQCTLYYMYICYAQSSDSDHRRILLREPRIQALRSQSEARGLSHSRKRPICIIFACAILGFSKPPTNEIINLYHLCLRDPRISAQSLDPRFAQ